MSFYPCKKCEKVHSSESCAYAGHEIISLDSPRHTWLAHQESTMKQMISMLQRELDSVSYEREKEENRLMSQSGIDVLMWKLHERKRSYKP